MLFIKKKEMWSGGIVTLLALFILAFMIGVRVTFAGNQVRRDHPFAYLSPGPGAGYVPAESTIALRPAAEDDQALSGQISFLVRGAISGLHRGRTVVGGDGQTIIFRPYRPFSPGERIQVEIRKRAKNGAWILAFGYSFKISPISPDFPLDWPEEATENTAAAHVPTALSASLPISTTNKYVTAPGNFPIFQVAAASTGTGEGYVFLGYFDPTNLSLPAYALILDNQGEPVYYHLMDVPAILDFKLQPNGLLSYFDPHPQRPYLEVRDESYQVVNTYQTGNGYRIDLHDSYVMDNGRALLLAAEYRPVDMSQYIPGGDPSAVVKGCVIQEVDTAGNVLWQWRSLDHIPPTDSVVDLTAHLINYIHCNSIELDDDGNLLLSSRHLHEVTKIDRQTGAIIWRLGGGKGNQFIFVNDPHQGFFYQHDARRLGNGHISVYDNRTGIDQAYFSRGVEYELNEDPAVLEATMVWQYINTPVTYSGAMGNMQRLPGGNSLIGWGFTSQPLLTESTAAGEKVFELSAATPAGTYRAFRYPWEGHPEWPPALVAHPDGPLKIRLFFSWNGATEIAGYLIYGDPNPIPASLLAEVPRDGFETTFVYQAPVAGVYYFRVMPVDKDGKETTYSPTVFSVATESPAFFPIMIRE